MTKFMLGTHQPGWLSRSRVPLFVSDRRLRVYKTLPRAAAPWACDSGGFTELQQYGRWTVTPREYIARVRRYRDEIGQLLWAAPQDWMCEPIVINGGTVAGQRFAGTGLSVAEHQRRTVVNYIDLRGRAPDLDFIPVVQGDTPDAYRRCVDLYLSLAGIDLTTAPRVGVGSICRRQGTTEAGHIIAALRGMGLQRLHLFGFKVAGLVQHRHLLTDDDSADSMAWSDVARKLHRPALPECVLRAAHKNCANCFRFAMHWRRRVLAAARPLTESDDPTKERGGMTMELHPGRTATMTDRDTATDSAAEAALLVATRRIAGQLSARADPKLVGLPWLLIQALKTQEEAGELAEALIGAIGANPRKGVTHTWDDVLHEAVDVAVTALVFIESARPGALAPLLTRRLAHLDQRATAFGAPPISGESSLA